MQVTAQTSSSHASLSDYFELLKPRVMSLAIFTALCGILCAPGNIHPVIAFAGIFAIALGAGGAGCLNMWWERHTDALMNRTRNRPIPSGRVSADAALGFGMTLSCFSVLILLVCVNYVSAALLAFTIFFYAYIYTALLKPNTPQNIVIGGAAGALPPVVGWACVTGDVGYLAVYMFAMIFLWTPPHFWALALKTKDDFAKASLPMMPNIKGDRYTRRLIVIYSLVLSALSYSGLCVAKLDHIYFVLTATTLNFFFVLFAIKLWLAKDNEPAMRFFGYTIFYLFIFFLLITVCHFIF